MHRGLAVTRKRRNRKQREAMIYDSGDEYEPPEKCSWKKNSTELQAKSIGKKNILEELFSPRNGKNEIGYSGNRCQKNAEQLAGVHAASKKEVVYWSI